LVLVRGGFSNRTSLTAEAFNNNVWLDGAAGFRRAMIAAGSDWNLKRLGDTMSL
jgi:hypothetical protein